MSNALKSRQNIYMSDNQLIVILIIKGLNKKMSKNHPLYVQF